jgi:hypothetical protein
MPGRVAIHGLEPRQGETAFALVVLRMRRPIEREDFVELVRHMAPMIPDAEEILASLADEIEEAMQIVGIPWMPPEQDELEDHRALIESTAARGVDAAWFFQAGTSLPTADDDEEDDDEDYEDESDLDEEDEDDEDEEDEEEAQWSHGPPPQRTRVPFPVEGYPEILEEHDWEDFGIAFKLAGPFTPGENTVLLGFHALWLSAYGTERYRNAAVTIDRRHHSAHLWVDRFAVPCSPEEQAGHLLWVLSKLHEVTPVLHARFGGATMAQKYGGLMGDTSEPFVLGGNPLLAIYAESGEAIVDRWIAEQTDWSNEEVAQMLRELAEQIVASDPDEDDGEEDDEDEVEDDGEIVEDDDEDDDEVEEIEDDEEEGDDEEDEDALDEDDGGGGDEDEGDEADEDDRERQITTCAGELLTARARAGVLDARTAQALRPVLSTSQQREHRRTAVVEILGALRDRASVPEMIRILEENPIRDALDAIGKEALIERTASALEEIADPAAIPALAKVAAAPGPHNDRPRPAAAAALAACLAAAPGPRDVDDAVLGAMLEAIRERDDGELTAELHLACARLARQLAPARRDEVRRRLAEVEPACDDAMATLARHAALVLAGGGAPDAETSASMRPLVHAALTGLGYDHAHTVRSVRIGLRVAELLPELVAPADLVGLTRFAEPELRERAHALLARLHQAMPPARCLDVRAARALSDDELIERAGDPHVVGRAALVGELARRDLGAGRAAVRAAVQDVVDRAPPGEQNLLAPDARLLELAIRWLCEGEIDDATLALLDRVLRHGNPHVKWALLEAPPDEPRLLGGMFYVLAERWSWQEEAAREWLSQLEGTQAFEAARRRAGVAWVAADQGDGGAEGGEDGGDEDGGDEEAGEAGGGGGDTDDAMN